MNNIIITFIVAMVVINLTGQYFALEEKKLKSAPDTTIAIFHDGYMLGSTKVLKNPAINIDSMYKIDSVTFVNKYKPLQ